MSSTDPLAVGQHIPMPAALNVHYGDTCANFNAFEFAWTNYCVASGLDARPDTVQLCTLMCALGEPAQQLYLQLSLSDEQSSTVAGTLAGLRQRLCGAHNMRLDRRHFNRATQRPSETYAVYFERLRQMLSRCQFDAFAVAAVSDEFLLDRILCSISDRAHANRLATTPDLTLEQAIHWCQRHEQQPEWRPRPRPPPSTTSSQPMLYEQLGLGGEPATTDNEDDDHDNSRPTSPGTSASMRLQRRHFNRATQHEDETYAAYFERLRTLLRRCQFADSEDILLDRILSSIRDEAHAQRMAGARGLTLHQAVTWCERTEALRSGRVAIESTAQMLQLAQRQLREERASEAAISWPDLQQYVWRMGGMHSPV